MPSDQRVGQAVGQTYSKKDGLSDKIFCPARSLHEVFQGDSGQKQRFPQ